MTIDCHVHFISDNRDEGSFVSHQFKKSLTYRVLANQLGVDIRMSEADQEHTFLNVLRRQLYQSKFVNYAVLLALDATYNEQGEFLPNRTPIKTSNKTVMRLAHDYPEFLPGISIHPYREDAIDKLEELAEAGAVLCKWVPNTQNINGMAAKCQRFYRALVKHQLPLLTHCGREHTLPTVNQRLGDPTLMQVALESGVKVILAHGGSSTLQDAIPTVNATFQLMDRFPNCYADLSALLAVGRLSVLRYWLARPEYHSRLLFGTDYPVPMSLQQVLFGMDYRVSQLINSQNSYFDKYFLTLWALGFQEGVFNNALAVLGPTTQQWLQVEPKPTFLPSKALRMQRADSDVTL